MDSSTIIVGGQVGDGQANIGIVGGQVGDRQADMDDSWWAGVRWTDRKGDNWWAGWRWTSRYGDSWWAGWRWTGRYVYSTNIAQTWSPHMLICICFCIYKMQVFS